MDGDIIARVRAEEADLARKLKAVRDLLVAYGEPASNVPLPPRDKPEQSKAPTTAPRGKVSIDGFSSYGQRVVASAMMQILVAAPHPMKTREIVDYLTKIGMKISGREPVNAVGALLSRSVDLVSHGKTGWTIADEDVARDIVSRYAFNENEASTGAAGEASENEEGATSSIETQTAEELFE